jgi:hypothetical protein
MNQQKRKLVSTELKPLQEPAFINDDVDATTRPLYVREIANAAYAAVFRDRPDYMKPKHDTCVSA